MRANKKMKTLRLSYALLFSVAIVLVAVSGVSAQDTTNLTEEQNSRFDSLQKSYDEEQTRSQQAAEDSESLSDLKSEKRLTREKAKEARRIEKEANDAAMESRRAYKSEKKAQNARKQADKQSKKADRARDISDQN